MGKEETFIGRKIVGMDEGIYVERLLSDDERSRPKSGKK